MTWQGIEEEREDCRFIPTKRVRHRFLVLGKRMKLHWGSSVSSADPRCGDFFSAAAELPARASAPALPPPAPHSLPPSVLLTRASLSCHLGPALSIADGAARCQVERRKETPPGGRQITQRLLLRCRLLYLFYFDNICCL